MPTGTQVKIGGVTRGALGLWLIETQPKDRKTLVILPNEDDAASLVDDTRSLFRISDWGLPSAFDVEAYEADDEPGRQAALYNWRFGRTTILATTFEALDLPVDAPERLGQRAFAFKPGLILARPLFEEKLSAAGYSRNDRAEQVGEYAVRGDVIDIWMAGEAAPSRLTWNFDTLESIRVIDVHTQRSDVYRTHALLKPVSAGADATLKDYATPDVRVVVFSIDAVELPVPVLFVGPLGETAEGFQPAPLFAGHLERLKEHLQLWHADDWRAVIFCHNRGERERLEELLTTPDLAARGLKPSWLPPIEIGDLEHGFEHPQRRQAVLANSEIFGRFRKKTRLPKFEAGAAFQSPFDIRANDYLVHERHGIGRYQGLRTLRVGKVSSEYLALEYKGGDKLYVPIFEIQQVQKYLGAEGKRPPLSSLDTAAWERIKSKVKEDVAKLAAELLGRAAKRSIRPGYAFPPRTHLEDEFAASFMYKLTVDQEKTLEDVERDMTAPRAMDRLICGDVGYGKTEIAMRAALKAALAGKQVCVLCPTTILAEQHARNFTERMADYPVTVKFISRFQDKNEQKKILELVGKGGVDIIIGTHRLLSPDVVFNNIGLLVIDEEHRFGVKQKNKLLALRETFDVLSLTATPIPRTLAS